MIRRLAFVLKDRFQEAAALKDLLCQYRPSMMKVVQAKAGAVFRHEDIDVSIVRISEKMTLDIFPKSFMSITEGDFVTAEIIIVASGQTQHGSCVLGIDMLISSARYPSMISGRKPVVVVARIVRLTRDFLGLICLGCGTEVHPSTSSIFT